MMSRGLELGIFLIFITQVSIILLVIGPVDVHSDVTFIRARKDRDLLIFDEKSKKWVNKNAAEAGIVEIGHTHMSLDITDLNTTTDIPEGSKLYYTEDRVAANSSVANNTTKVSDDGPVSTHSDVNVVDAEDNELFFYDISSGKWVNKSPSEVGLVDVGHTHILADITDLTTTTDLPEGTNLYYTEERVDTNLSVTANTAKTSASGPLTELIDVSISSITNNQVLSFDGISNLWLNRNNQSAGIALQNHTHPDMVKNLITGTSGFANEPYPPEAWLSLLDTTSFLSSALGSRIIPANSMQPGTCLKMRSAGIVRRNSNSSGFKFRTLSYETNLVADGSSNISNVPYELNITFSVTSRTAGMSTGFNAVYVVFRLEVSGEALTVLEELIQLNLSVSNEIDLEAQPNVGNMQISSNQFSVVQIN
jgi:hypothetical protein